MKHPMIVAMLVATTGASAAPRDAMTGMATGKVSVSDLHFSTRAEAMTACDKAPIATAADGSFTCTVTAKKGVDAKSVDKPGVKHPDLMK